MNFRDYQAIPAVNWSLLKEMQRSPLHFRFRSVVERDDTPAMRFGRACHTAVLEPDRFPLDFEFFEGRRAGKAWTDFAEANAAKTILTVSEYETALAVRDAVRANPDAAALLDGCTFEHSITWTDPVTGIACKARPDAVKRGACIDLKTTRTIDARKFGRVAYDLAYFGQFAFYTNGLAIAEGNEDCAAYVIAVESEAPHDCGVFRVDDDSLYAASLDVRQLLDRLAECERTGAWPGRYTEPQTLELPPWEFPGEVADEVLIAGLTSRTKE